MCNIKIRDFYDVIAGYPVNKERYGFDAAVFKKVDNVDLESILKLEHAEEKL